jgi:hypothetical protein
MADDDFDSKPDDGTSFDILDLADRSIDAASWIDWRLDADHLVLGCFNPKGPVPYEVDLNRCRTSAEVLDWIFQLRGKGWAQGRSVSGFIAALNDVVHPQEFLCSSGQPKEITSAELIRLVDEALRRGAPTFGTDDYDEDGD